MGVSVLFSSHTPVKDFHEPDPGVADEVDKAIDGLRQWVAGKAPDLVVIVGPDHFNGFFYRLMPSFCIGVAAESVGDWNTPAGPLPVASDLAARCVSDLHTAGIDVALSHQMEVDHGITQTLSQIFSWQDLPSLLPVFINCAAPPRPPLVRVVALGRALGEFVAQCDANVLLVASGGLSHDPPIPVLADAPEPVRKRLIEGGRLPPEARAKREQRVIADAARQVSGESLQRPLNPDWDEAFLERLSSFDFQAITAMKDDAISHDGGCGGHEIRTWIAVAAAAEAAGIRQLKRHYYRAIPQWVAGYGMMIGE